MKAAVLLAALCAGLALLVASQLRGTPATVNPETSPSPAPATVGSAALPKIVYAGKQAYARISDDNLFGPERRPVLGNNGPSPAPRARPSAGQPNFELKGIIITPKGRYALLKLQRENDYRKVVKGESVEGWIIDAIASDNISVKKQGTSTIVKLQAPKPTARRTAPRTRPKTSRTPQRR